MVRSISLELERLHRHGKALHWLIALLIFVLFPLGWIMDEFSGVQKDSGIQFP